MTYCGIGFNNREDSLSHFGIKGQKWGVRRFQNEDGSLTAAGKQRYLDRMNPQEQKYYRNMSEGKRRAFESKMDQGMSFKQAAASVREDTKNRAKKVLAIAAGATVAAIAGYMAYKGATNLRNKLQQLYTGTGFNQKYAFTRAFNNLWTGDHAGRYVAKGDALFERGQELAGKVTRRSAVVNWLKNKGSLKVSDSSFDNLVVNSHYSVRDLADAGAGTAIIRRR